MPEISEILPKLVHDFPAFRSRWEKHLAWWKGEPAGYYNDMAEFVHFVVEELYPAGETDKVQQAFDLMEQWLAQGGQEVRDLVVLGFFETVQNVASWQPYGSAAFAPFLGEKSREAWSELERAWTGKGSLMDVIRGERGTQTPLFSRLLSRFITRRKA